MELETKGKALACFQTYERHRVQNVETRGGYGLAERSLLKKEQRGLRASDKR